MTTARCKHASCLIAVALALTAISASAQVSPSDSFTVFDPTGNIFASVFAFENTTEGADRVYFINNPTLADPSQFQHATSLIEPDNSRSDIFGVIFQGGNYFLAFNSDSGDEIQDAVSTAFGTPTIVIPEGNGVFDATMYLQPGLQAQGYRAEFQSDPITSVPDGGTTFGLLGVALAALALLYRKWDLVRCRHS